MLHNSDISRMFEEIADLLELEEASPFRVRAYRNAASTVEGLGKEVAELIAAGEDLTRLPGIGKDLAGKINEALRSGHMQALDELHARVPESLERLLKVPGLGPKRVKRLYQELGVETLEQLQKAAASEKVRGLSGFGEKTEKHILDVLAAERKKDRRFLRSSAVTYAEALVAYLKASPGVLEAVVAGSYRRGRDTVGDLDILVTAAGDTGPVMERFTAYEDVAEVVAAGPTKSTVLLASGLQVDLRILPPESFGAALHYFTGSKAHNIQIRRLGQQRGLKISEYGVFEGAKLVAGDSEESVFRSVGLPWIPPELREDRGEIEAAAAGRLPELIAETDLRGDLHVHTNATDGHASLEAMVRAARERGLKYIAVTDHSRHIPVVRGLDEKRLREQLEAIDRLNETLSGFTVLKGIEVDILENGKLALPDSVLRELDLVVGAVHDHFDIPRRVQTERIMRAMDHRYFSILAHPSGRLLQEREPYAVDMPRVIRHARERGCWVELNCQPRRLDLYDIFCQLARDEGVLIAIDSDAHGPADFGYHTFGIAQARRGWLEKKDVANTRGLRELRTLLAETMA